MMHATLFFSRTLILHLAPPGWVLWILWVFPTETAVYK